MSGPSVAAFVRHAEQFGVEGVLESASGCLRRQSDLDLLRIELDAIERSRKSGRFTVGKRRRRSESETARFVDVMAEELAEQGLVQVALEHRIADKLGLSDAYVRRLLKTYRSGSDTGENAPRKPTVQAERFATKRETGIGAHRSETSSETRA